VILSPEEVLRLLEAAPSFSHHMIFSTLYGTGVLQPPHMHRSTLSAAKEAHRNQAAAEQEERRRFGSLRLCTFAPLPRRQGASRACEELCKVGKSERRLKDLHRIRNRDPILADVDV
jgi:hypothetical protein